MGSDGRMVVWMASVVKSKFISKFDIRPFIPERLFLRFMNYRIVPLHVYNGDKWVLCHELAEGGVGEPRQLQSWFTWRLCRFEYFESDCSEPDIWILPFTCFTIESIPAQVFWTNCSLPLFEEVRSGSARLVWFQQIYSGEWGRTYPGNYARLWENQCSGKLFGPMVAWYPIQSSLVPRPALLNLIQFCIWFLDLILNWTLDFMFDRNLFWFLIGWILIWVQTVYGFLSSEVELFSEIMWVVDDFFSILYFIIKKYEKCPEAFLKYFRIIYFYERISIILEGLWVLTIVTSSFFWRGAKVLLFS